MQITHHNIMVWDLDLHAIAIKRCFGMLQPRMRCLMIGLLLTGTKQKIEDSSYINNGVFIWQIINVWYNILVIQKNIYVETQQYNI